MQIDAAELRAELGRRNWSYRRLATEAGLSEGYVRWIARGARPHDGAAIKILAALGEEAAQRVLRQVGGGGQP